MFDRVFSALSRPLLTASVVVEIEKLAMTPLEDRSSKENALQMAKSYWSFNWYRPIFHLVMLLFLGFNFLNGNIVVKSPVPLIAIAVSGVILIYYVLTIVRMIIDLRDVRFLRAQLEGMLN